MPPPEPTRPAPPPAQAVAAPEVRVAGAEAEALPRAPALAAEPAREGKLEAPAAGEQFPDRIEIKDDGA